MSTLPLQTGNRRHASWLALLLFTGGAACNSSRDEELAALSSPEGPARAQAIAELGKKGDEENLGDIMAHVGDPDVLVRSSVASVLGNYDVRKAADALGELAADPAEPVQVLAARSLARQKNPRAHSYLLLAYRRDGSAVRAAVVEGLEKSGGSAADAVRGEAKATWEQLSSALTKGGAAERVGAAEELGRSGRPEAVERLVPYLGADSRALAQAAALGLGESGLPQAREPLEAMLNDPDPDLQMAALQGLEMLAAPESTPALVKTALKGGRVGRAYCRPRHRATHRRDRRAVSQRVVQNSYLRLRQGLRACRAGWVDRRRHCGGLRTYRQRVARDEPFAVVAPDQLPAAIVRTRRTARGPPCLSAWLICATARRSTSARSPLFAPRPTCRAFRAEEADVAVRIIHACGQVDVAQYILFGPISSPRRAARSRPALRSCATPKWSRTALPVHDYPLATT